ncbi:MAG: protein translocase subunit secY/sec61 alpha [Acidimicrobiales bacterium]|nr:protein translocase subunit secY/sec61 alpha [Acidimicrobiales bacterium]
MFSSMKNMFKVPDLRNKIIFTLVVIAIYRIGSNITVPGIDFGQVQVLQREAKAGGVLGFLNLFSGGALTQMAVFALGIMPYITASIIMQLLAVVIPKIEQWQKQGAVGQKKITQWTRYMTVGLAILQATGITYQFHNGFLGRGSAGTNIDLIKKFDVPHVAFIVLTITAGTALVMWLAELITQRGIGNGMSILIFANVVSRMPAQLGTVKAEGGLVDFIGVLVFGVLMILAIVFVEQGQRRIPVQFAKRQVGRRLYGGQSTYIPLKVNQAGVIPIIFASSVLYFPVLLSNVISVKSIVNFINKNLVSPTSLVYILFYGLLIIFFTYFYTAITFDPHQQADIIRKQGGFIPGIRPGAPTEKYLGGILNRITLPGSLFLATIALLPQLALRLRHLNAFPFGGTTVLIAVGVALETMKQIDSQLMMRNYEGFLSK